MPITRSHNKATAALVSVRQDNPQTLGTTEDGATTYDAPASAPSSPLHKKRLHTPESVASMSTAKISARSVRSSDTIKAQILAAKADHARRLAEAQAERDRITAERERAVADLELEAKLAAIEAGSIHSSSGSQRVEKWLANCINIPTRSKQNDKAFSLVNREENKPWLNDAVPRSAPATAIHNGGGDASASCARPVPARPTSPLPTGSLPPAEYTQHAQEIGLGTRKENDCCCYKNKSHNQDIGTPFIQLANAITSLGKKTTKVCDISKFDGRASDWLLFKKSYDQSKAHFSSSDNIARLSAALHGAAREAVSIRLVVADDPEQIVQALENRFAQPEVIVLHQLSLVRALPKLGTHEATRELNIFACRIRNCVEVIRLLNQPEYLASPELANSILGKLTPLLRSRWADFASVRIGSGKYKLEILADFLEQEASLQIQFGVMSEPTPIKSQPSPVKMQCQPVKPFKDKVFPYVLSDSPVKPKSTNIACKYCSKSGHEISDCGDFQSLSLDERWQWVLDNKVCRRCLRKGSHQYKNCKKRCEVETCASDRRHHTLLHRPRSDAQVEVQTISDQVNVLPSQTVDPAASSAIVAHNAASSDVTKPLLKVVPVTLVGPKGSMDTYALLDDGSSATLVDKLVADVLVDEVSRVPLQINCIGGLTKLTDVSFIDIKVRGRHSVNSYDIRVRSIPNLGLKTQSASISDLKCYGHLSDIAEILAYDDAKPTCLIGTDNWHLLLPQTIRHGTTSEPAAALTPLGWALFGFITSRANPVEFVNHAEIFDYGGSHLDNLIKYYYRLDSIGIEKKPHCSLSDKRALEILEETAVRLPSGRFEVGLLWRNDIKDVPDSRSLALSRFSSLERKLSKNPAYAASYKQNVQGMIDKGYAELCTGPPQGIVTWYLPHFGVVHPKKKKLRVVHDAAAKCNGVSLNSMLLSGPDLLQPLLAIVMRFRENQVALTADIREMFPQVKIRAKDRDAQRFFWRESPQYPLQEFRMSSMIFGATSSPCTALFLKNKNASDFQHLYPEAARSIVQDHYMDDYLGSVNSTEEAARLAMEIVTIHKAAGFEMRSWVSNQPDALALIPPDLCATDAAEVGLGPSSPSQTRVLGLTWLVTDDSLCFIKSIPSLPETYSKRSVLSLLMSVYDPLGLMTPLVIKGRIIFQKTWKLGLDWDHSLPEILSNKWKSWFHELKSLAGCSIPRCYSAPKFILEVQLHVFADASELAYACAAYWRFTYVDGSVQLALIGGKARLAPLKPSTIPRLELQAALIAARFASYISEAHRRKPDKIFMWSDSITVLKWLRSDACSFKAFVSFRVGEISELSDIKNWRYVPTGLNVADDATRDTGEFSTRSRWFVGPSFLLSLEDSWPSEPISNVPPVLEECKNSDDALVLSVEASAFSPPVADYRRFSNWLRLLRATARVYQAAKLFRSLLPQNSHLFSNSLCCNRNFFLLSHDELQSAEINLFKRVQLDSFFDELTCVNAGRPIPRHRRLRNMSLLVGEDGLLRLFGRTSASSEIMSRPIVLDGKHQITKLLIHSYHTRFAHANHELVVNELRQRFYVVGLRPAVRQVATRCQACRVRKAKPTTPPTGDLPVERMAYNERPFTYVGLDYFGPISVTIGRRTAKRWIALFTCLTIRAVHLEIVESLSSDSAIMALRRFIARRGCPTCIYSDNGTAFVGAAKILPEIYEFATTREIRWKFIPPSAPFMGGCWERLVRNIKSALIVTLAERAPREEVLATLLSEAEAIVNSRPLTHVSVDPDSETALTPFTFLIGSSSNDIQTRAFDDTDLSSRAQWRKSQRLADHFWQRFVTEYLPTLVPRRASHESRALKNGDLVFLADGTLPRRCWPRGRIVETYPGKDGIVRVVDVATKGGVLRRPVRKLAPLFAS